MRLLRPGRTLKENNRFGAELVDDLAARPARRTRDPMIIGDGDCLNLNLRTQLGDSSEDCRPLGAVGHSVRGVLHIATGKDLAVGQQNRRAHMKIGIGGMRILHDPDCRLLQLFTYADGDCFLEHKEINSARSVAKQAIGMR